MKSKDMKRHVGLVALLLITALSAGCLFGGGSESAVLAELSISAASDSIVANDEIALMVVGTSTAGDQMVVRPNWVILSGTGSLASNGGQATFTASGWEYDPGDSVTIQAYIGDIASEPLTIEIDPLLRDSTKNALFPRPDNFWDPLPSVTESHIVSDRQPVEHMWNVRIWQLLQPNGAFWTRAATHEFIAGGQLLDPGDPLNLPGWGEADWYLFHDYPAGPLPDYVYLSHRVHYERADAGILYDNASYSQSVAFTRGTSKTEATEFAQMTSTEFKAKSSWAWGEVSLEVKHVIENKSSQSVTVSESQTVTETKSVNGRNDYITRFGIYNRVDTFYLSDVNGVPIDVSPIFAKQYLLAAEVSFYGTEVAIVTHRFDH